MDSKSVFIVHGRNEIVKTEVFRFLTDFRLSPIILNEQANEGMTVIEKFEKYANVGYAVVLMTDDDLGKEKSEENLSSRARQNVVLELGYFIAKSRGKICILYSTGVELPSDLGGVIYELIDSSGNWKNSLKRELLKAGYDNIFSRMNIIEKTLLLNTQLRPQTGCRISALALQTDMPFWSIEGDFGSTYLEILFDSHGQTIDDVEYTYADFGEFTFYVHVHCHDTRDGKNGWRWIQFQTKSIAIVKAPNHMEKQYPVKSTLKSGDWKSVRVDIQKAFDELFQDEGLSFYGTGENENPRKRETI